MDAGHTVRIVALSDSFVTTSREEIQYDQHHEIPCYRLSEAEPWPQRIVSARVYADQFEPDWVSWQIVPYAFHAKGVIPREAKGLRRVCEGRHVHAMLHELWVGLSRSDSLKNRIWGVLQRRALKSFVLALRPSVLHTSNTTYQAVLANEGWRAELLPLFGNIPIADIAPCTIDSGKWVGGIFGTVHPQFDPKLCFETLIDGARASRRNLRIIGIGRLGSYGEQMFAELAAQQRTGVEFDILGEKTPDEVSRLLQTLDFGIATHPWALAGKSGAVAAMLDHGLPVVVPRDDWVLRQGATAVPAIDPLLVKLSEMPPELMAGRLARRRAPASRLHGIAAQFLSSIGAVSATPVS